MFERLRKAGRRFFARPAGTRFHGRYLARRQQQGGLLRKVLILTLGSLVVLLGIVLMPLPGPGLLIVFIGATLIAEESEVAARLLDRIDLRLQPLNRRWKRWRAERRRKRKT
jgi:uncharacterized protein (TIGR02611 family)